MIVTLRQLEYLVAVSENGSYSKGAESCHAEQSTLSHQIKLVEEKLGVEISIKGSIPITPTKQGKEVINQAKYILAKVNELIAPFKNPVDPKSRKNHFQFKE